MSNQPILTAYHAQTEPFRLERLARVAAKLASRTTVTREEVVRFPRGQFDKVARTQTVKMVLEPTPALALHDYRDILFINWAAEPLGLGYKLGLGGDASEVVEQWYQEGGKEIRHFRLGKPISVDRRQYNPFTEPPIPEDPYDEERWQVARFMLELKRLKYQAKQTLKEVRLIARYLSPAEKAVIAKDVEPIIDVLREAIAVVKGKSGA
jgi:hypothetical protein